MMKQIIVMEWTMTWDWQPMPVVCNDVFEAHEIASESAEEKCAEAMGWKWESNAIINWRWPHGTCAVVHAETGEIWAAWKVIEIDVPNMENV
tara:strand:- start:110 stop:385 length:276 start_codon:yes stop_codon:yes gene_type:complete